MYQYWVHNIHNQISITQQSICYIWSLEWSLRAPLESGGVFNDYLYINMFNICILTSFTVNKFVQYRQKCCVEQVSEYKYSNRWAEILTPSGLVIVTPILIYILCIFRVWRSISGPSIIGSWALDTTSNSPRPLKNGRQSMIRC
jgi:hypothetical protein